jgi:HK97 family phage prohead protease
MMPLVSALRFKQLHRKLLHRSPAALGVLKQVIAPPTPSMDERRALRFCISTGAVDREQDSVAVTGWDLRQYQRNPVVLWGHDASRLPIGRAFDVKVEGDTLMASVEFIPEMTPEAGAFAEAIYRLAKQGFLGATSVGFRPLKWEYTTDKERGADDWFPGIDFTEQELVEFSIVTVPANPEALIEEPLTGEGTAIAADTPPESGEELTSLSAAVLNDMQTELAAKINEEQARARARRRRMLQLATARMVDPVPDVPPNKSAGARRRA